MEIKEVRTVFDSKRFRVVELVEQLPNGDTSRRFAVRHPGSVVIVPMVDEDHVCLIENFRVVLAKKLIELPAGTLEPGEDPAVCARRELIEETGYRAESIDLLHTFYAAPGILDENMRLFIARNLTAGETAREQGENIENLVVSWDEALSMIFDGRIQDAKTIVGLLYCDRLRRRQGR